MRPAARYGEASVVPSDRKSHRSARMAAAVNCAACSRRLPFDFHPRLRWSGSRHWCSAGVGRRHVNLHAPRRRSATSISPVEGSPTTATEISSPSTSARFTQYSGIPEAKFRVPQIGSTSQYGEPSAAARPPRSSPITEKPSASPTTPRTRSSTARSAARHEVARALGGDVFRRDATPRDRERSLHRLDGYEGLGTELARGLGQGGEPRGLGCVPGVRRPQDRASPNASAYRRHASRWLPYLRCPAVCLAEAYSSRSRSSAVECP